MGVRRLLPLRVATGLVTVLLLAVSDRLGAQECPAPPRQAQSELDVEARVAVGKLARVTGGDLSVRTRQTVKDLLARVPDANVVYLEQMLFAAYCSAVRDDPTLTRTQRADRLARYARDVRAALPPPPPPRVPPRREPPPARDERQARARQRARDSLAFEGIAATDTAAFFRHVREGNAAVVRLFLAAGLSPNVVEPVPGARGGPAVGVAATRGDTAIVAVLLAAGARPDLPNRSGYTALIGAAGAADGAAVVRLLLAHGADATHAALDGVTPLHAAAEAGDTLALGLLLGVIPEARRRAVLVREGGHRYMTPLNVAVRSGSAAGARFLLRAGASADRPAEGPPLCTAVQWAGINVPGDGELARAHRARYFAVARTLIEEGGARVDVGCDGHSVLAEPLAAEDTTFVAYLIARGADPNRAWSSHGPPLVEAVGSCVRDTPTAGLAGVQLLLARGARADGRWAGERTALMRAAARSATACAEALLAAGADVNARDEFGMTPLLSSADGGHAPMVALLLGRGADPRAVGRDGGTALMQLVRRERERDDVEEPLEAAALLLRAGVDRGARRADGKTALDLARANGWCEIAARLGGACAR